MGSSNRERTTCFVIVGMNRHQKCHHNPKRTLKMSSMGLPPLLSQQHPLIAGGIGHLTILHGNTRLVYFLYFADAFHKAAGNTSLLISATWEIENQ